MRFMLLNFIKQHEPQTPTYPPAPPVEGGLAGGMVVCPVVGVTGVLGMPGMTAWVGLNLVGTNPGETVFISGAAGAVGSVAGQLAKQRGCRVIGSAGSPAKVTFLREECHFDVAFDYKTASNLESLQEAAPDGIDVYFDNVGGEALEAALATLKVRGRIAACGAISLYNLEKPQPGPSNLFLVVVKRLTMRGFIVSDWLEQHGEFQREVEQLVLDGKLKLDIPPDFSRDADDPKSPKTLARFSGPDGAWGEVLRGTHGLTPDKLEGYLKMRVAEYSVLSREGWKFAR